MSTLVVAKPLSIATGDDYAFHRRLNEKVPLVCPFSSDQDRWLSLEFINVHDGKKYRTLDCKENKAISYHAYFHHTFPPSNRHREHPEATSPAPGGTPCKADIRQLLKCTRVIAGNSGMSAKKTDRKWEEGYEISILEFKTTEYGRSMKVIATEEIRNKILEIGINMCARESGFDRQQLHS